jgi:hypothetical protein
MGRGLKNWAYPGKGATLRPSVGWGKVGAGPCCHPLTNSNGIRATNVLLGFPAATPISLPTLAEAKTRLISTPHREREKIT